MTLASPVLSSAATMQSSAVVQDAQDDLEVVTPEYVVTLSDRDLDGVLYDLEIEITDIETQLAYERDEMTKGPLWVIRATAAMKYKYVECRVVQREQAYRRWGLDGLPRSEGIGHAMDIATDDELATALREADINIGSIEARILFKKSKSVLDEEAPHGGGLGKAMKYNIRVRAELMSELERRQAEGCLMLPRAVLIEARERKVCQYLTLLSAHDKFVAEHEALLQKADASCHL